MVAQQRAEGPSRQPRMVARFLLVALVAAVVVPLGQFEVWSTPVTLSETLEGVEPDPDATDGTWSRSVLVEAPMAFSAAGASAPAEVTSISMRTSPDGERWEEWQPLEFMDVEDGPDPGSLEERDGTPGQHTEALWVGEATHLQLEVEGASTADVELTLIDSMHLNDGPVERHVEGEVGAPADASGLNIVSRARWGADESLGSRTRTVSQVHMGVVHHTAHRAGAAANTYTRDEAPGLMRAMHRYHTATLGWADIGYNVLVDRYGTIYEGRKGGFSNGVVGAHAAGFNSGSFGVSVIGNFLEEQAPAAAIASLTDVIAAKSAIHGIDPAGWTTRMGDGTARPTIVGHRDVGRTSCPGRIQDLLPRIRSDARADAVRFPDVPATSPHRAAIMELADAGVTSGCKVNAYCPREGLNRAQASTFVLQALGLDPIPGSQFRDVPANGTHAGAINALVERGWLIGYPDGTFRPWEQLSRAQLATLLARASDQPLTVPSSDPYPDVSRSATHAPGIAALANIDIRGNCGYGRFCADDIALRDSTASFVHEVRKFRGSVSVSLTVQQSVAYEGEPSGEQPVPASRIGVDLVDADGSVVATATGLQPGDEVVFTDEDGLRAGRSYSVEVVADPSSVPPSANACVHEDVDYSVEPDATVVPVLDGSVDAVIDVELSYRCPG